MHTISNQRINVSTELEMTHDARQNGGKFVTSNIASARNQRYLKDSVFWLAQRRCTLCPFANSSIFVGHRALFQAVCLYVNYVKSVAANEIALCPILLNLETIAVKLY